jgi:hypothetical protein
MLSGALCSLSGALCSLNRALRFVSGFWDFLKQNLPNYFSPILGVGKQQDLGNSFCQTVGDALYRNKGDRE